MQVLTGQGRRELSGEFGWLGDAVGTEGLDKIIIFIIGTIYLTVTIKLLHHVASMHVMILATFECFRYNNMIDACHRVVLSARSMVAANDG